MRVIRRVALAVVLAAVLASATTAPAVVLAPAAVLAQVDEAPTLDGRIRQQDLQHDSRDDLYRAPLGAVPAGIPVKLRLRAAAGDLSDAQARFTERSTGESWAVPMERVATDLDGGDHGYEFWQVEVESRPEPTILDYTFVAQDGQASRHLFDDRALDGGTGQIGRETVPGRGWQLTFYEPGFTAPAWAPGSVVYQIFPDRFANGDHSNDPSADAAPGSSGAGRYRHGDVYGNPILALPWVARPEGHCRAYQGVECASGPLGRDFFGGDLAGITAGLAGLADLGITVLYLNPIFAAPSNHRYDTSDYAFVDPDLGTLEDFDRLIGEAGARGIRVVLDGVFNHVSSDSPWFDRARRFDELGACEDPDSPYRDWFTFREPGPGEPQPCAPSTGTASDTYYVGWFNFDTIPELQETPDVTEMFVGADGVVRSWIDRGTAGWRLDVSDSMSHEFQAAIRDAAKAASPEAIVIAEQWGDSTPWLLGDQADSTMNYRFRRAVIGLVNGDTADPDGSIEGLAPSRFVSAMLGVRGDYPQPAYQALLNLVDSHDTARILWTLTPGADNEAAKSDPVALAEGKAKLRLVSAIQLTFPGMASIYYGDEVGLSGHDDPDDRRPYPWGAEDLELREHYRSLARLRADHEAIREGDLTFLHADDAAGTLAYLRRSEAAAALVALNLSDRERRLVIDVQDQVPDGVELSDALGQVGPVAAMDGQLEITLGPRSIAALVSPGDADLLAPDAPTGLFAEIGPGWVVLDWEPVAGAARYRVLRSLVSGGGYQPVSEPTEPTFVDEFVRDGVPYHYTVEAIDAMGNVSPRVPEAVAVTQVTITRLAVNGVVNDDGAVVNSVERALSAVDGAVSVEVAVQATAEADRIGRGVIVEVGMAPEEVSAIGGSAWSWSPAQVVAATEDGILYQGLVQPDSVGGFSAGARASTDGGETWRAALGVGHIEVVHGSDLDPPHAPSTLELLDVSGDRVRLRWAATIADDLYRYVVLRGDGPAGEPEVVGSTDVPVFLDSTVTAGARYVYLVQAQDTSYNTSLASDPLEVVAEERLVAVTFTVSVPAGTPPDDGLYIAGGFQGWDPGGTVMARVDEGRWAITLEFEDQASLEYKYTRGSWEAVEKDAGCGEIPNRTLTVEYGSVGMQDVLDIVEKWRDIDACG